MNIGELRQGLSFLRALGPFLRDPLSLEQSRQVVRRQLAARAQSFQQLLDHAVFASPNSPYLHLLRHAGIARGDVSELLLRDGLEGCLERLRDAGVYVTLDEFKGRQPIERGSLRLEPRPGDFDNPLLGASFEASSGGSRGAGTRVLVDLALLTHEAAYAALAIDAFGLDGRPRALWRPVPPGVAGLKEVLRHAKIGKPMSCWFSQRPPLSEDGELKHGLLSAGVMVASRLHGRPLPIPVHVPSAEARLVATWLVQARAAGSPGVLDLTPSGGVRVCQAAAEYGLDISGSTLRVAGEPFTPARAAIFDAAGCDAAVRYSMAEVGMIGLGCPRAAEHPDGRKPDDVHILSDKIAVGTRRRRVGATGGEVETLLLTTALPCCPKLMLNVEVDDHGVLGKRRCGCALERLGLDLHLHSVRSIEKLTSGGMSFTGADLLRLIDEVLPERFGGQPTDYQLVEEERGGLPRVHLHASPRLGALDETAVLEAAYQTLGAGDAARRMMAQQWREEEVLRVRRRDPLETAAAKVLPLHVLP